MSCHCLEDPHNLVNQYSPYDQSTMLENPAGLEGPFNDFLI